MLQDFRSAFRSLRRHPGFTCVAVATFALGAAANAAVLAIAYGILFKPLPLREPERLVAVAPGRFWSNIALLYLRERASMFSEIASVAPGWTMALTGAGEPAKVTVARVSDNFFRAVGAEPLLGRGFVEGEARPGADSVAVLSHSLWVQRFGSDPDVVGRSVRLDGFPFEIVGVMPAGFELFGRTADLWTPFALDERAWYHKLSMSLLVGRLSPGWTIDRANLDFAALIPAMRRELGYSEDFGRTARLEELRASMVGTVRSPLYVLAGAVALVLLIGGANVGSLLLTRTAVRAKEIAVKSALGASGARLARELMAESAIIAISGGVAGLALAWVMLPAIVRLLPPDTPRAAGVELDVRIGAAVLAVSAVLALLVGAAPAAASLRVRLAALLRVGAGSESRRSRQVRSLLVAGEIALALVLSTAAGLMLQSIRRMNQVDLGFNPDRVLTFHLHPDFRRETFSTASYYDDLLDRVRQIPGVVAAGAIQHLPFSGYSWTGALDVQGHVVASGESRPTAGLRIVTPGYFEAIGQPIVSGREIARADVGRNIVVVNETLARRYFGSADRAIGKQLRIRGGGIEGPWLTVIGVAGDVRHDGATAPVTAEIYTPVGEKSIAAMMVAVRTAGDPVAMVPAIRDTIRAFDRNVPIADVQTMAAKIGLTQAKPRLLAVLLGALAASGLVFGLIGVYGVVAYSIAQRRQEIGIRMALGAGRGRVVGLVLREGAWYAVVGVALGIPAAVAASSMMRTVVFGITVTDAATYALAGSVVLSIVLAASYVPARRASRLPPLDVLRLQ